MNSNSQFPIKDWKNIPIDVYKGILNEAKLKLDEITSQSEYMTKVSIQMLLLNVAIMSWFSKYAFDKQDTTILILSYILFTYLIFVVISLVNIIFPRSKSPLKGTSPSSFLESNATQITLGNSEEDKYTDEQKEKAYLYISCWKYDDSIALYRKSLSVRAKKYEFAIKNSFVLFVLTCLVFIIAATL
jgi:hypothetical protein